MDKGGLIIGKGHVIGLELYSLDEGLGIRYAYLQKKKNKIELIAQGEVSNWEALKNQFGDRIPLAINLNTSKVLTRSITGPIDIDANIQSALPNVDTSTITASVLPSSTNHGIGLVRRDIVASLLEDARSHGFRVTTLLIGPWSLMNLSSLTGQEKVSYGGWELSDIDGNITVHKHAANPDLSLSGLDVEGNNVLAFSTAWQQLAGTVDIVSNVHTVIGSDVQEETARLRYEFGMVISAALLVILLVSQLVASNYLDKKEGALNTSLAAHQALQQEIQQLEKDAKGKQLLVSSLGIDQEDQLTLTAWEVLQDVPKGIRLNELTINPMKKITENKHIAAELGVIRVSGTCEDTREVNNWMNTIRGSHLFTGVRLLAYSLDEGVPHFEIEIKA